MPMNFRDAIITCKKRVTGKRLELNQPSSLPKEFISKFLVFASLNVLLHPLPSAEMIFFLRRRSFTLCGDIITLSKMSV